MNTDHLTNEELQSFIDGTLVPDEAPSLAAHLQVCAHCRTAHQSLRRLDGAMKSLPAENLGSEFTRNILARLNIVPQPSILFRVVENLAYVFGMMIVLGVMIAVFVLTGIIDSSQVAQTQSAIGNITEAITGRTSHFMESFAMALQSYLPFLFGDGNLKIAATGTCVVGLLAVLDRFLKKRILR